MFTLPTDALVGKLSVLDPTEGDLAAGLEHARQHNPYSINQASYDLGRLTRNSLITRIPHRNLYTLTPDGLRFAIFCTKVHDRVLRPLMAGDQPHAPPPLRAALRTIDTEVSRRLAAARLPAAA
jgi:hypothetical protein